MKKKKKKKIETLEDKLKYEIAGELGFLERIDREGWGSLTAKETGKIGGLINVRKKQIQNKEKNI